MKIVSWYLQFIFNEKEKYGRDTKRKKSWQIVASLFPDAVWTPRQIWFENNHSQRIKNYCSAFSSKVYSQFSNSWSNQNVQVILKWTHLPSFTSDKSRAWKWESEERLTSHFPQFNSALIPRLTQVGAGLVEGGKRVRKHCISMCGITSEHEFLKLTLSVRHTCGFLRNPTILFAIPFLPVKVHFLALHSYLPQLFNTPPSYYWGFISPSK